MGPDKNPISEYKIWLDGEPLSSPGLDTPPEITFSTKSKRTKRQKVHTRRMAFLLVTLLTVICVAIAICMMAKVIFIVNEGDHLLLPLLMTVLGTAGALSMLAEWLISKERD